MSKLVSLIFACTLEGGIGYNNKIPWDIKDDLNKFKEVTMQTTDKIKKNAVIMGSNTYNSLPVKKLKDRINIVITRWKDNNDIYTSNDIYKFTNINKALEYCNNSNEIDNIFIIGGSYLYNYFLENNNLVDKIYLSIIKEHYDCDVFIHFDKIYSKFNLKKDKKYENEKYISYICYNKI
jgi:dihydrofolate reductase